MSDQTPVNPLELSDEDFFNLRPPESNPIVNEQEAPAEVDPAEKTVATEEGTENANNTPSTEDQGEAETADPAEDDDKSRLPGVEGAESGVAPEAPKEAAKPGAAETEGTEGTVPSVGSKPEGQKEPLGTFNPPSAEEAQSFFMKVMAPIKANGKTIELRTPEEAIQLMQQGANYTQKMQAIAPHRKMLTMAQNNGITEDKLSFLIDLEKGNPEAIQKFLRDKGVDPLSIDTDAEPTYREGTHKVSDTEVAFQSNLEELSSTPEGKETLQEINSTWDNASKEALWGEPGLMPVIHAQKQNGVYDRISSEVSRRRILGQITPETPFIEAYQAVGNDLLKSDGFADLVQKTPNPVAVSTPRAAVATTVATPKPAVDNGDKARSASPTRSTPKPAKTTINPLSMSDEEFKANFASMRSQT